MITDSGQFNIPNLKSILNQYRYLILLIGIFIGCEVVVDPYGDFPLNDDWSYALAIKHFYATGEINPGKFPAMSLCTQILWGYMFTKVFGFTFMALRLSTIVSAIIGLVFIYKLTFQIGRHAKVSALACLVLLFNPIFFNLTNTFMTDVHFNTILIVCIYYMYNYFNNPRLAYYLLFTFFSVALVLLRQYGIILPACFFIASFFGSNMKKKQILLGVVPFVFTLVTLKIYENYLSGILPRHAAYMFSGNTDLLSSSFWFKFIENLNVRGKETVMILLEFSMPFILVFLPSLMQNLGRRLVLIVFLTDLLVFYILYKAPGEGLGGIFYNMIVGPETFYESFTGARHNVSDSFGFILTGLKIISGFISLFGISMCILRINTKEKLKRYLRPDLVCLILLIISYIFMIINTISYFDRYLIPLFALIIILFAYLTVGKLNLIPLALIPLAFWAYVSVLGTKDYLELNRKRWEAYQNLRQQQGAHRDEINGGFEVNCWYEGEGVGWKDIMDLSKFRYLIQFNNEAGFKKLQSYPFQRYLPYKTDTIFVFEKSANSNNENVPIN